MNRTGDEGSERRKLREDVLVEAGRCVMLMSPNGNSGRAERCDRAPQGAGHVAHGLLRGKRTALKGLFQCSQAYDNDFFG